MSSVVIVGASCVPGLALARLLRQSGFDVFAVVRSKVKADELSSIGCKVCVADVIEHGALELSLQSVPAGAQFVGFLGGQLADGSRVPLQAYKNVVDRAKTARVALYNDFLGWLRRQRRGSAVGFSSTFETSAQCASAG